MDLMSFCWDEEFSDLDLGDERLNRRFVSVLNDLSSNPSASLYSACQNKASTKGAYRLMNQEKLETDKVWEIHRENVIERMQSEPVVLLIQDTTTFNFHSHMATKKLGRIGKKVKGHGESQGLIGHTILAITPQKLALGITDQVLWSRGKKKYNGPSNCQPFLEKESAKWFLGLHKSISEIDCASTKTQGIISVSDRESDINAYIGGAIDLNLDMIVRAKVNRKEHISGLYIEDYMKTVESCGSYDVEVLQRSVATGIKRKPRKSLPKSMRHKVKVDVRFGEVQLKLENIHDEPRYEKINCVYVCEKKIKSRLGDQINWILLTSLPVESLDDAQKVIEYYSARWTIEVFHKALKTGGCRVEDSCLQTADRLKRYITLESLVALQLCRITYYHRCYPEASCEEVVRSTEWKALYCFTNKTKKLPKQIPSCSEFTIMMAKLGGYKARNSDRPPGQIVLRRGWERLQDIKVAYELFAK